MRAEMQEGGEVLRQDEKRQGEGAGSTHGAQPPSLSTSNSQDSESHPRNLSTYPCTQLSRHGFAVCHSLQYVPQLHIRSPGRVKGSSKTSNSPSADS